MLLPAIGNFEKSVPSCNHDSQFFFHFRMELNSYQFFCFKLTFFSNFILPHSPSRKQGGFCEKIRRYYLFSSNDSAQYENSGKRGKPQCVGNKADVPIAPMGKKRVCRAKAWCFISSYSCEDTLLFFPHKPRFTAYGKSIFLTIQSSISIPLTLHLDVAFFISMPRSDRQQLPAKSAKSQSGSQPGCQTICISGGHGRAAVFLCF